MAKKKATQDEQDEPTATAVRSSSSTDDKTIEVQLRYGTVNTIKGAPYYFGGGTFSWSGGKVQPGEVVRLPIAVAELKPQLWVKPGSQQQRRQITDRDTQLIPDLHADELLAINKSAETQAAAAAENKAEAEAKVKAMIDRSEEKEKEGVFT